MEIRPATLIDITNVLLMLGEMQQEMSETLDEVHWPKVSHIALDCINRGLVLAAHTDEGDFAGSVGGVLGPEWYSEQPVLSDYWFYVRKDFRASPAGFKLMKAFKALSIELNVPLRVGHTLGKDLERMDKFYGKLGFERTGTIFRKAS